MSTYVYTYVCGKILPQFKGGLASVTHICGHVRTQLSRPNSAPRHGREPKRAEGRGTEAGGEWGRAPEAKAEGFDGWRRMCEHKDALNRKGPTPRPCLEERPFVRARGHA